MYSKRQPQQFPLHPEENLYTTGGRPWTMYQISLSPQGEPIAGPSDDANLVRSMESVDGVTSERACPDLDSAATGAMIQPSFTGSISVVSYNVLADSLVSFEYIPYCRGWNQAAWNARPGRILQKVRQACSACVRVYMLCSLSCLSGRTRSVVDQQQQARLLHPEEKSGRGEHREILPGDVTVDRICRSPGQAACMGNCKSVRLPNTPWSPLLKTNKNSSLFSSR